MKNTRIMCAVMLDTKVFALSITIRTSCSLKMPVHASPHLGFSIITYVCLQGPEIRTGFLKNPDQPVKLTAGKEITITTDYEFKGDDETISMRCTGILFYHQLLLATWLTGPEFRHDVAAKQKVANGHASRAET